MALSEDELVKRVAAIERQITTMMERRTEDATDRLQEQLTNHAFVRAVQSMASEIAAREGISEQLFSSRFQALCRWHLDVLIRTASDNAPSLMAQLDGRSPDEIPIDEAAPLIFGPPTEAEPN